MNTKLFGFSAVLVGIVAGAAWAFFKGGKA